MLNGDLRSKAENGGFLSKRQVKILSGAEEEDGIRQQAEDDSLSAADEEKEEPLIKT